MTLKARYQSDKIKRDAFIKQCNPRSFDFQIATWFGSGLIIPAPGTWGTLGGLVFGVPLLLLTNTTIVFLTAIALFFIGLKSVERLEQKLDSHDPSFIVIDEVAAILLVISTAPFLGSGFFAAEILISFLLFRFFDAKKPWLVGMADKKIKGAWGVMMDDIVAAMFAILSHKVLVFSMIMIIWMIQGD